MGFRCAAAHCRSDSDKKLSRYPWMSSVRWVKWPKDPADISRWKRLVRRGGRKSSGSVDVFNVDKRTRLCSRHFDQESISVDKTSTSDPKYFAWNNWGNDRDGLECYFPWIENSDDLPEVGADIVNPVPSPREDYVGQLNELKKTHDICQPAPTVDSSTQTSLTSDDIEDLLRKSKARASSQTAGPTGKHFVKMVTDTDERVNFYTGNESSDLLHGVFNSVKVPRI